MKQIELSQGKVALVDDADYESLNQFNWQAIKAYSRDVYYAIKTEKENGKWRTISMHRVIMNAPNGMDIDHKDTDGLNNQRYNLRLCTRSQNSLNRKKRVVASSKYKNVHFSQTHQRWIVRVSKNGTYKSIGVFKTELEAGIIANITMRRYHGKFARPNILTL